MTNDKWPLKLRRNISPSLPFSLVHNWLSDRTKWNYVIDIFSSFTNEQVAIKKDELTTCITLFSFLLLLSTVSNFIFALSVNRRIKYTYRCGIVAPTVHIKCLWWHQCVEKIRDRWETALINHLKVFIIKKEVFFASLKVNRNVRKILNWTITTG
jgi:hypothetical protein